MCTGGRRHVNAKCNSRSRPALVIECIFVAEGAECERKHFVLKGFYKSNTNTETTRVHQVRYFHKWGGVDEKECKLDCFRFDSGQIGFVAGCLFDFWKHFMATLSSHAE